MNAEIGKDVKNLIRHLLKLEDGTPEFAAKEKSIISTLKSSDTMSFVTKKDMDLAVKKMADKYDFHACFKQAEYLRKAYEKFITKIPKDNLTTALNVVKFLLCMSEQPVLKFLENPAEYSFSETDTEETINWREYLLEGIEIPEADNETSDLNDTSSDEESTLKVNLGETRSSLVIPMSDPLIPLEFALNREELKAAVQIDWFEKDRHRDKPPSEHPEAKLEIIWEKHLDEETFGLLRLAPTSILSEYKIMREILWQMNFVHDSFVFTLRGDYLDLRTDVTISSVRSVVFERLLCGFLEHINLLQFFRKFIEDAEKTNSETFIGYAQSIDSNIIRPLLTEIIGIETLVKDQEISYTLISLQEDLNRLFEPLKVMKQLHERLINETSYWTLTCRLHESLYDSYHKLEQDVKLTIYLDTLYRFFRSIDSLLSNNNLEELNQEFVRSVESTESENWLVDIVINRVLPIVKNIKLLIQLRKYDVYEKWGSLHHEFKTRVLKKLNEFYSQESDESKCLYKQISKVTSGVFPVGNCFENITNEILRERFSISGLAVKNILIVEHRLDGLFDLLRSVYLFTNGSVHRYFQQFFVEMDLLLRNPWRYNRLAIQLKDTINSTFPDFKNLVRLTFDNRRSTSVIGICQTVNIEIIPSWPLNIIVSDLSVYRDVFTFLLKLNWALYALRHLRMDDLHGPTRKRLQIFRFDLLKLLNAIEYFMMCFVVVACRERFESELERAADLEELRKCHGDFIGNVSRMVQHLESCQFGLDSILECVRWILGAWKNQKVARSALLEEAHGQYQNCYKSVHSKLDRIYLAHY